MANPGLCGFQKSLCQQPLHFSISQKYYRKFWPKFPPINLTFSTFIELSVCARHHARLSCTLVNKPNKVVRFKIREMPVLTEKNYRKPITCLCLVSESQDGCGFLRPLPGFLHICKSWLCSIKSYEM